MITGIGIDIAEISRFFRAYSRFGQRLARRILATEELLEFAESRRPERYLAMRWAAKEAVSKALGTGFKQGVRPKQIRVAHDSNGKPSIQVNGRAAEIFTTNLVRHSHISLSDDGGFAIAIVLLET